MAFQTWEDDHGPFPTPEPAEYDLKRYVDEMSFFDAAAESKDSDTTLVRASQDPDFADFTLVDKD